MNRQRLAQEWAMMACLQLAARMKWCARIWTCCGCLFGLESCNWFVRSSLDMEINFACVLYRGHDGVFCKQGSKWTSLSTIDAFPAEVRVLTIHPPRSRKKESSHTTRGGKFHDLKFPVKLQWNFMKFHEISLWSFTTGQSIWIHFRAKYSLNPVLNLAHNNKNWNFT